MTLLDGQEIRFVRSGVALTDAPTPARPEVAFVGRSNVGKSSLLNTLFRRKRLAQTSKTPGKTQTLNWYSIGETCYFVDLPGYGYAKVPDSVRKSWGPMMERYLGGSDRLAGVVALVDGRHPPTALDRKMIGFLAGHSIPALVVLTKADKVKPADRAPRLAAAVETLGVDAEQVVWFSSVTGEGRDDVAGAIAGLVRAA